MQESGEPLIGIETYRSLHELATAFESAAVSNARIMFDDEKVYYLSDDFHQFTSFKISPGLCRRKLVKSHIHPGLLWRQ